MKLLVSFAAFLVAVHGVCAQSVNMRQLMLLEQENIEAMMDKVIAYQMEEFGPKPAANWKVGTFFSGVMEAYKVTKNPEYFEVSKRWCEDAKWTVNHIYHADDVCKAQTFLEVYFQAGDKDILARIDENLKPILSRASVSPKKVGGAARQRKGMLDWTGRNIWSWCDALYMQPPVMAQLAKATGNQAYLDLMDEMYWDVHDFLYSPKYQLFFRDEKHMPDKRKTPKGKPVFWGRGNGWVIGGLVRTIDYIPEDDPRREKYISLFQDMMASIVRYQQDDGLWRSSLNEPSWHDTKETSGSSFYTYGLFAGINRGWLDAKVYLPNALRAWEGLCGCLSANGKLGYAQLVAAAPSEVRAEDSIDYTHGAFLLAASEVHKMNLTPEKAEAAKPEFDPITIAHGGAWTWFNDERIILTKNFLLTGYLDDSDGRASVAVRGMKSNLSWHAFYDAKLSSFEHANGDPIDDHNNPALLQMDDGRILAAYAQHHKEAQWYTRIADPKKRYREWSEEKAVPTADGSRATYSNLFQLMSEEGRIYNFYRGAGFNPNVTWSDDRAETWSEPFILIRANGARPYVKYCSDGEGRIDLLYTDGHPRDIANNIYHIYYEDGWFHRSDGSRIRTLEEIREQPLVPEDGTLVYEGSKDEKGRGWVWDLEYDADGNPVAAYISVVKYKGQDLRYRFARWNGNQWQEGEIARAGTGIYTPENHYAGGIAIDPNDPNTIYISANVDPVTGEQKPDQRYQIYRGTSTNDGKSFSFEQLTFTAGVDNLRPVVPHGHELSTCVAWFRGRYTSYRNYDCDVVAIMEP